MDWRIDLNVAFSDLFSKRNVLLLALFWVTGGLILAVYGTQSAASTKSRVFPFDVNVPSSSVQGTGPFTAWRKGAGAVPGPAYRVSFDNLWTEDAGTGPSLDASRKSVHIDHLAITFLGSSAGPDAIRDTSAQLADFHSLFAPCGGGLPGMFAWMQEGLPDWDIFTDLTNAAAVRIHHLDWRVRQDGETVLRVQCEEAELPADKPEILLRGDATLTLADATLQGDSIRVDVQTHSLVADGWYVLQCPERTYAGAGTHFDTLLRPAGVWPISPERAPAPGKIWFLDGDTFVTQDSPWPAWQGLLETPIRPDRCRRLVEAMPYDVCDTTASQPGKVARAHDEIDAVPETGDDKIDAKYFLCWNL